MIRRAVSAPDFQYHDRNYFRLCVGAALLPGIRKSNGCAKHGAPQKSSHHLDALVVIENDINRLSGTEHHMRTEEEMPGFLWLTVDFQGRAVSLCDANKTGALLASQSPRFSLRSPSFLRSKAKLEVAVARSHGGG